MSVIMQMFTGIPTTAGAPGTTTDSLFNYVSLLLNSETISSTFISDASTNNLLVSPVGSVRNDNYSPFQGAGYYSNQFNGSNDFLTLPTLTGYALGTGDYTVECWINRGPLAQTGGIITSVDNVGPGFALWLSTTGQVRLRQGTDSANTGFDTVATIPTNTWTHIAAVRSGNVATVYINGINSGSVSGSVNITNSTFTIGASYVGGTFYFNGNISNLRVVKGTAVYTNNFAVPTSPLTAITGTQLLTCQSPRFVDLSSNAATITVANTPKISYNQPISGAGKFNSIRSITASTDYLSIANSTAFDFGSGDFTIEGWINYTTIASGGGAILSRWGGSGVSQDWILWINSSGIPAFNVNTTNVALAGGSAVPANTWTHMAATRSGNVWRLFVNGTQVATSTLSGAVDYSAAQVIRTNRWNDAASGFVGYLSNVRVVKGTALYTANFTPSTTPLTAITNTSLLICQGNALDASTNAFALTSYGAISASYLSPFNNTSITLPSTYGSGYFGSGDYLSIPSSTAFGFGASDLTVECWVYLTAYVTGNGGASIFDTRSTTTDTAGISLGGDNTGKIAWYLGNSTNVALTTATIPLNQWTHIAGTRSGNTWYCFINGVGTSGTWSGSCGTSQPLLIGKNINTSPAYVSGYISNVRIVKGTAVYTGNFTPSTTPLTAVANTALLTLQKPVPATNNGFLDSSQTNVVVTKSGTTAQGTFTPFSQTGWSTYFPGGTNTSLSVPTSTFAMGTGQFCIEAWVNFSVLNAGAANTIIQSRAYNATGTGTWSLYVTSAGVLTLDQVQTPATIVSGGSIAVGSWYHVAVSRDSSNIVRLFVNGELVASAISTFNFSSTNTTYIGYNWDANNYTTTGFISNVRIVTGSPVYTAGFTPSTSSLTAISGTQLLTLQNNRFKDNSTNNLTITSAGSASVQASSPFAPTTSWSAATNGGSVYMDGSNYTYLTTPMSGSFGLGTGDYTVEGWYYVTGTPGVNSYYLVDFRDAGGGTQPKPALLVNSSMVPVLATGAGTLVTGTAIAKNAWTHIAFSRASGSTRLFVNGVQVGSTSSTSYDAGTSAHVTLGNVGDASGSYNACYVGYMSNVRVTTGTALYTSTFTPPTAPATPTPLTSLLINAANISEIDYASKNDVTNVGIVPIQKTVTKFGTSSLSFNGSASNYLTTPLTPSLQLGTGDFTIELWFNQTAKTAAGPALISNYNSYTTGALGIYAGHSSGSTTKFQVASNGTAFPVIQSTTSITPGVWQHIALVRIGNLLSLYIDGVINGTATVTGISYNGVGSLFYIGNSGDNLANGYLNGYIDDLRITKGVARYTGNFTPPTQALPDNSNSDPYFNSVTLLLHGDAASSTQNVFNNNTFIDSSVSASTLTRAGSSTQGTFSPFDQNGWSVYFNGTSDYIRTSANAGLSGNYTIEAFFYLTSSAGGMVFGAFTSGTDYISVTSTGIGLGIGSNYPVWSTSISVNAWHHFAIVKNGSFYYAYLDGNQLPGANTAATNIFSTGLIGLGSYYTGVNNFFPGFISNARIVNGTALYTASTYTVPTSPLTAVAGTVLLTCQSNNFVDNSTNNYAFTLAGTPSIQATTPFAVNSTYSAATNGGSMYFNGTSDYTTLSSNIANTFGTQSATVEFWMYPTAQDGYRRIVSSTSGVFAAGAFVIRYNTGNFIAGDSGGNVVTWNGYPQLNAWNHIAWVGVNGASQTLYVNGVSVGTAGSYNITTPIQFVGGYYSVGPSEFYAGYMSNLRILKGTAQYTGNFTPPSAPLPIIQNTSMMLYGSAAGIIDATGKNNLITVGSATTQTSVVKYGTGAMSFNGSTDYVTVTGTNQSFAFGSGDFTIEAWGYRTALGLKGFIDMRPAGNTASATPAIYINANNQFCYYVNGADRIQGTTQTTTGTWYHVAVCRSGTSTRLFINGVQEGITYTDTNVYVTQANRPVIGCDGGPTSYFAGYIDDVRITRGYARYTGNFTPPNAALPTSSSGDAYFQYNSLLLSGDIQSTTIPVSNNGKFIDASANSLAITANGTPTQGTFTPFDQNGWSGYFPGDQSPISIASTTAFGFGTGNFTIEAWIYPTANPTNGPGTMFDFRTGATPTATSMIVNSSLLITFFDGPVNTVYTFPNKTVTLNTWNHIAYTRSGNTVTAYINGTSAGTASVTSNLGSSQPLMIGANNVAGYGFNGYISNVRIVKGTVVYTGNFTPPTSPLTAIANTSLLTLQSNRFVDNSTNNFTITPSGTPSIQAATPFAVTSTYSTTSNGGSMYFNGSADYLSVADTAALQLTSGDFTIEFWFYANSTAAGNVMLTKWSASNTGYYVGFATNNTLGFYSTAVNTGVSSTFSTTGAWTHVAAVKNGTTYALYINGTLANSTTSATAMSDSATALNIGRNSGNSNNYFNGYLSNVRIVKGTAVYTANFTPSTTPLTAIANTSLLLSGTNDAIIDNSGSNSLITTGTAAINGSQLKYGTGSMYFDGSGAMVKGISPLMSKFGTGDFTVEAWVYPTARNTYSQIFGASVYATSNDFLMAITTSGALYLQTGGTTTGSITTTTLVSLNTWSHIAVTRTGGYAYAYINGVLAGMVANTVDIGTSSLVPTIGSANGGTGVAGSYYTGYIDDLRVTKGIARYKGGNFTPPTQAFPTK